MFKPKSSMLEAARAGQLEIVEWLHADYRWELDLQAALEAAGRAGEGQVLRWLYDLNPQPIGWDVALGLARGSQVEVLEYLLSNGHIREVEHDDNSADTWREEAGKVAASAQDVRVLQVLREINPCFSVLDSIALDATSATLSVLQWVVQNDKSVPDQRVFCAAAAAGRADIVDWMLDECPGSTSVTAAKHAMGAGHRELAQRLADRFGVSLADCRPEPHHLYQLVKEGRYDDVVWIDRQCGLSCNEQLLLFAIEGCDLLLVQLLYQRSEKPGMTSEMMVEACRGGILGMVKWVYQRLPANLRPPDAFDSAAALGFPNVVEWLHHNTDLPCTTRAMDGAASCGNIEIVRFLHENRAEGCTTAAMDGAATWGGIDVLEFLHRNRSEGCGPVTLMRLIERGTLFYITWIVDRYPAWLSSGIIDRTAASGRLDVLQYFHTIPNAPFSSGTMDRAATMGKLRVVHWLHDNRTEGCTAKAMGQAGRHGYLSTVQFLHQHGYPQCSKQDMECATGNVQDWWRSIGVLL
ncbi:hypothetical protein RI367_006382 [Sorochytrium milnesiophthora]